jgi:hypothetical protein
MLGLGVQTDTEWTRASALAERLAIRNVGMPIAGLQRRRIAHC